MEYIVLAIAPGIAICMYFFYKDIYNKEPKVDLLISFLLGCLAILPAIGFERALESTLDGTVAGVAIFSYAVVAFGEEASKFLGLRLFSFNQRSFDEPLDGIVYAVMVSMGFATVENIMYVQKYAEIGRGLEIGLYRMFLSVPAHATFAVIMGYFVGKAKFNPGASVILMITGVVGAIFFHGTFDFFIFVNQYSFVGQESGNQLLFWGAIVSYVVSIALCRKLIRSHRNLSREMFKEKNTTASV